MDLVKSPPAVRPAEGELDPVRWATRQQALEASITVHLQHAREPGQVGGRMLAFAVLGIEVDHRRRGAALPGSVIDRVAPQAAGLGPAPAGVEHRQARSSRAGESHPRALTEPYVNLSAHTALVAQPDPRRKDQCANSRGRA